MNETILTAAKTPEWPFRESYADGNPRWRKVTPPQRWMRNSVVWSSRRITEQPGAKRFAAYAEVFGSGNKDASGDRGKDNGLTDAWLSSSLRISPAEQIGFLTRMFEGSLPVPDTAAAWAKTLMGNGTYPGGVHVCGKTGAGVPFGPEGDALRSQPFGWSVGWAEDKTVALSLPG